MTDFYIPNRKQEVRPRIRISQNLARLIFCKAKQENTTINPLSKQNTWENLTSMLKLLTSVSGGGAAAAQMTQKAKSRQEIRNNFQNNLLIPRNLYMNILFHNSEKMPPKTIVINPEKPKNLY